MTRPIPIIRPATTMAERHIELIMNAFDRWERRIEGSPTWEDVDDLMCDILRAINPESCQG